MKEQNIEVKRKVTGERANNGLSNNDNSYSRHNASIHDMYLRRY